MVVDPASLVMFALAFAVALTLSLKRPGDGVAMLLVAIPFDLSREAGPTTISLAKVTLLGVALALVLRRTPLAQVRSREALTIGAGAAAIALATILSIHAADYRAPAIRESLKALQYLAIFVVTVLALRIDRDAARIRTALAVTTLAVSALAIAQLVTGAPSGMWFGDRAIPRVAGPLEGPNQLSGFLCLTLCSLFACALRADRRDRSRVLTLVAIGFGSAALLLSVSRSGVSTSLAALALVFALTPRGLETAGARRSALAVLGASLAGGLAILGGVAFALSHSIALVSAVFDHFGQMNEVEHAGGVGNRSILWHAALTLWRGHPLLGIGAGNFELEIGRAGPPGVRTHANSLYLQALVEGGLPLLLATVASVAANLTVLFEGAKRAGRDPLVLGAACGLAGLAVHQIFDFLVFYPKVGDLAWTLTGVGVAALCAPVPASERDVRAPDTLRGTTLSHAPAESSSTR